MSAVAGLLSSPISSQACEFNAIALVPASAQTIEAAGHCAGGGGTVHKEEIMKKAECMRSAVGLEPTLPKPKKINKR